MTKRYVSTGEAADYLGIHPETLRRWVTDGLVTPTFRTPRRGDMRWDLDDLDRQLHHRPAAPATTTGEPVPEPQRADQPQYPAISAAIVTSRLGVLITKRNDRTPPYGFPAGKNELGESPADCAIREVKEETGLLIKAGATIGERIHPATGKHMVYIAATPATRSREVFVGDREELAEVRWATLAEVTELMPDMYAPVAQHLRRVLSSAQAKGQRKAS